jgi:hypothetical protein
VPLNLRPPKAGTAAPENSENAAGREKETNYHLRVRTLPTVSAVFRRNARATSLEESLDEERKKKFLLSLSLSLSSLQAGLYASLAIAANRGAPF